MDTKLKVSCFGAGFVGLPTTSVLAFKNLDTDVLSDLFSLSFLILMKKGSSYAHKEKFQSMSQALKKHLIKYLGKI